MAELVRTTLPSMPCSLKIVRGFVGEQVVGGDVDFEREGPLRVGDDAVGRGGEERGGVDEDVDAAELAAMVASSAALMASRLRMSMLVQRRRIPCRRWRELRRRRCCAAFESRIGDDDVRAALGGEQSDFAADAAASADDESDAAAELFLGRLAANLGLFQLPVLDAEGFAGRAARRSSA